MAARKLTGLNGRQILKALQRGGFELLRVSGSHHILRNGAQDLLPGTVRSIISQSGLTADEFISLL